MAFIKLSDDTIKQITKAYYLDRTDPNNPVVRLLRTGYRVINGVVEEIFRSILTYTIAGEAATFVANTDEVFSIDINNDFESAPPSGEYFGDGAVFTSTTDFDVPDSSPSGSNNNYDIETEVYDNLNHWTIESNGRLTYNGPDVTNMRFISELTLSANISNVTSGIIILFEYDDDADTTGVAIETANLFIVTGNTFVTLGSNFSLTNGKQYGFTIYRSSGDTGLVISESRITIYGTEAPTISNGPPSYAYTIRNNTNAGIASGTYTPPGDSDNHSYQDSDIAHGLRDAIISTANTSINDIFTDDWTAGDDSEIPAIGGQWDIQITAFPTISAADSFVDVSVPGTGGSIISVPANCTIEQFVNLVVAETWALIDGVSDLTVSKVGTDTIRVTSTGAIPPRTTLPNVFFRVTSLSNGTGNFTIVATDGNDSTNTVTHTDSTGTTYQFSNTGLTMSGNNASFRSHIHTNTAYDFGLDIISTRKSGTNVGAAVNASEHSINGAVGQMLTAITMTDPVISTTIPSGSTTDQVGAHLAALHADISYDAATNILTTGPTNVITVTDPHTLTFTEI